jgi:hypothetical protein
VLEIASLSKLKDMRAILLEDITSYNRKVKVYGKKGDIVVLIKRFNNVWIVQGRNYERFPVLETNLKTIED